MLQKQCCTFLLDLKHPRKTHRAHGMVSLSLLDLKFELSVQEKDT